MLLLILAAIVLYYGGSAVFQAQAAQLLTNGWNFGNRWGRRAILAAAAAFVLWPCVLIGAAMICTAGEIKQNEAWGIPIPRIIPHSSLWGAVVIVLLLAVIIALVWFAILWISRVGGMIGWLIMAVAAILLFLMVAGGVTIPIRGAGTYDHRWIILVLMFIPLLVALGAAIWIPPLVWLVPAGANALASQVESASQKVEWAVRHLPEMKNAPVAVKLPRVPPLKKFLWPVALFIIASLLMGTFLYFVPVQNDPVLLAVLVALSVCIILLSIFDKGKGTRKLLKVAFVAVTLIICLGGRSAAANNISGKWNRLSGLFPHQEGISYNANAICSGDDDSAPSNAAPTTDPLGIKFSPAVASLGQANGVAVEDSGIPAPDGGTWAKFATPDDGIRMGKLMLKELKGPRGHFIYRDSTTGQALSTWSGGDYDGEILTGTDLDPDGLVADLTPTELDELIGLIQKREGVGTQPNASFASNHNDHLNQTNIRKFKVVLTHGCFDPGEVRVPRSWHTWNIDFENPGNPDQYFGIWFYGRQESQGPFRRWNMPDFWYPPIGRDGRHAEWMLQGKGVLVYRQTS